MNTQFNMIAAARAYAWRTGSGAVMHATKPTTRMIGSAAGVVQTVCGRNIRRSNPVPFLAVHACMNCMASIRSTASREATGETSA